MRKTLLTVILLCMGALGCATEFADPTNMTEPAAIKQGAARLTESTCSATIEYRNGEYVGCSTVVDGHHHHSDPQGLTERGCGTFCSALSRNAGEFDLEDDFLF